MRLHFEVHDGPAAAVGHALQPIGVLRGDGRGRNFRGVARVLQCAGVRQAQSIDANRSDQHRNGAEARGARGTRGSESHRLAVIREGRVEADDASARCRRFRIELFEAAYDEHVGLDPAGRRADAVAEAQHRH